LAPYVAQNEGLALRKIDVDELSDEARAAAVREFILRSIPYVRVFRSDGSFAGHLVGAGMAGIQALVGRAR
jgi:hypothetical protein